MYRDTEQSYGTWTLDVFQVGDAGPWYVDYWPRSSPLGGGSVRAEKRKEAIAEAKRRIDACDNDKGSKHESQSNPGEGS